MPELSVIIPFCNEYPQVLFTIQNIAQELRDRADFEIIAVNNYCNEVAAQGREEDKGGISIEATVRGNKWLKYLKCEGKLSHWNAKNAGVAASSGKFLFFSDAHCVISRDGLFGLFLMYRKYHAYVNGTLHLPLGYKILEYHRLIYKIVDHLEETGEMHYSFSAFRQSDFPYRVPCMSTCGMMMTREIYDLLGGWPGELGIYGGGENFINFSLAVLGKTVNIYPNGTLFHHGEKRGYHWNHDDYLRNRTIATYLFGGRDLATKFISHGKGSPQAREVILQSVVGNESLQRHRELIKSRQAIGIGEWARGWR